MELIKRFGKVGKFYFGIVRGIDDRPVDPNQETKSIGAEDTFPEDLKTIPEMNKELDKMAMTVHKRLTNHRLKGRTVTLKIKYSNFKVITRSKSFTESLNDLSIIANTAKDLLLTTNPEQHKIRLLGITVSNFGERLSDQHPNAGQLPLFDIS
jgi:DNA polymerase-4